MRNNIINQVIEAINKANKDLIAETREVTKNNGVTLIGISIRSIDDSKNVAPVIYVNELVEDGRSVDFIYDYVMEKYHSITEDLPIKEAELWSSRITDFDFAKNNLSLRLANLEWNAELWKNVPYREFFDLAVYPIVTMPNSGINSDNIAKVTYALINMWGRSCDEVFEQAIANFHKERTVVMPMEQALQLSGCDMDLIGVDKASPDLYMISSKTKYCGAVRMLDKRALQSLADRLGRDLIILPSSIHEVIAIPYEDTLDLDDLSQIVKDINMAQVSEEERLSDHAYIYRRNSDHWGCGNYGES